MAMCIFAVTICNEVNKAMHTLRNHRNRFDLAMIQVNNAEGDIFRFLSEIGSEMDLPIISKISNHPRTEHIKL